MAKTGIMGGTFDPIHYGHLLAAEECRSKLGIEKIIFVPTGDPPHKKDYKIASAEDRYAMTLLATAGVAEFSVSRTEIDRAKFTYTVDTLLEFNAAGIKPDELLSIIHWFDYERIPELCTLVTATRPGWNVKALKKLPEFILRNLKIIEIPQFAVSSTVVRERIKNNMSIRFLVPHLVEIYIASNGLYKI